MNDGTTTDKEPVLTEEEREKLKARHDELSRDIRKTALVLLTYCFFCFLTLGQSDEIIVSATKQFQIPFANTKINSRTFLWVGPLILILLTAYLHVFIYEHNKITTLHPNDKLPFIFNLENGFTKALTVFTFYALPCIIMVAFAMKVRPRPDHGNWIILAGLMCGFLLAIFILTKKLISFKFWIRINGLIVTGCILFAGFIAFLPTARGKLGALFIFIPIVLWTINGVLILIGRIKSSLWKRTTGFFSGFLVLGGSIYVMSYLYGNNVSVPIPVRGVMLALIIFWILNWMVCLYRRKFHGRWWFICRFLATNVVVYIGIVIFQDVMIGNRITLNLQGAELGQADLRGYFLGRADLSGADLREADLSGADLRGAKLKGAKLKGVKIEGAKLNKVNIHEFFYQGISFKKVDFQWADLKEAQLQEANLQNANLEGANLEGANLRRTNFRSANLKGANLTWADLQGANLESANLTRAILNFADLRGAKDISEKELIWARSYHNALYENEFRKKLEITDDRQRRLIVNYAENFKLPPYFMRQEKKYRQEKAQKLLKYYGLATAAKP